MGQIKIKEISFQELYSIQDMICSLHNEIRLIEHRLPPAEDMIREHFHYLKTKCEKYRGKIKIIEMDNKIVGYVIYYLEEISEQPDEGMKPFCYIQEIYIEAKFRKNGLGTRLINEVKREANGLPLRLFVFWKNRKALRLYKRSGFKERIVELELQS